MADKTFIPTTGPQTWNTGSNWSPTGVPATADRVYIRSGDGTLVITAGATQAAVLLAELVTYDTFLGSLTVDVHATVERHGFPSGSPNANGGSPKIVRDNGSAATTLIVYKTAASADATLGYGAVRWTGTHATLNSITVLSGSVDIATDLSAAVVTTLNVQGGTVTVGKNATTKAIVQTAGAVTHSGLCDAAGSALVSGGTITTNGVTLLPTVTVTGNATANLGHRPASGDACTDVYLRSGGTINLQYDPRPFPVTNGLRVDLGGSLVHFGLAQVTGVGVLIATPGKLQVSAA